MTKKADSLPAAEDYESMDAEEIEARLTRLHGELEETEELRDMLVGQTGQHVPGVYVRRYAEEIQALEEAITAAKNALAKKKR